MHNHRHSILELVLLLIAGFSAVLLTDFFGYWMPPSLLMAAAALVVVVGIAFAALFLFDTVRDEREEAVRNAATRLAYSLGLSVLLAGIAYRALTHQTADLWQLAAVLVMIAAVVIARQRSLGSR